MEKASPGCCDGAADCCETADCCGAPPEQKEIVIDFLYLDLNTCRRCQGTETNLDQAVREVSSVLQSAGFHIEINKINITSKELARQYRFLSSPTIRVNGRDIAMEVKESCCSDCGDLCGEQVDCRVWEYEGAEYTQPPKALIVNALLRAVYGGSETAISAEEYTLPENLSAFFDGIAGRQ